eukprot:TRINITY_DN1800_c0_g5_i1.p1 TRINITY_DN1800_c0_g5~~TRINITY_DN1800_c0_g5_i1.p1  ORF type:complete len:662 (+),score=189.25 TRINITY_DN1800_c0_g5_i1:247-2232(+)
MHEKYVEAVSAEELGKVFRDYASKAHIAGSKQNHNLAIQINETWTKYGFRSRLEEVPVYLNYPLKRSVRTLGSDAFDLSLEEAFIENDGTSKVDFSDAMPPFNGYSGSGNVTGPIVYANYGTQEDFELLEKTYPDLSFVGTVVLVRYGGIFRGNKVKNAEMRGAIAVLIFIDPQNTGYLRGATFPEGPWSTNTTVQRGSVWVGEGDPMSPGFPSVPGGPRLSQKELDDPDLQWRPLPKIPSLPINYADAQRLILGIRNSQAAPTEDWWGGLNATNIGPGPLQVQVEVEMNNTVVSIWNVIGIIDGSVEPDRLIMAGSHRDAWTFGAGDPISSTAVLMETARSLGTLLSLNWRPRRSIVLCSWDGEEYGLLGSLEFSELHAARLDTDAVTYVNIDVAVNGGDVFYAAGVPSFQNLVKEVTSTLKLNSENSTKLNEIWNGEMEILGSGSDHVPFIHILGISSLDIMLTSSSSPYAAVYHSNYDNIYYYEKFIDPGYKLHAVMARAYGLLLLKIADSEILPINHITYANAISSYLDTVLNVTNSNSFDVKAMRNSIENYRQAALAVEAEIQHAQNYIMDGNTIRSLNDRLYLTERVFLGDKRTSGDKWLRHVIFTPSPSNVYAGLAFPALFEALDSGNLTEATFVQQRLAQVIDQAAKYLQKGF